MKPDAPVMISRGRSIESAIVSRSDSRRKRDLPPVSQASGYTPVVHEMGVALEVYRTCREAVRDHGPGRIDRVRLAVGELAAVEPDLIRFAWEAVVADGPDQGAVLEVDWRPATRRCPACARDTGPGDGTWLRVCTVCGHLLALSGGDELDVLELIYLSDDDTPGASKP